MGKSGPRFAAAIAQLRSSGVVDNSMKYASLRRAVVQQRLLQLQESLISPLEIEAESQRYPTLLSPSVLYQEAFVGLST